MQTEFGLNYVKFQSTPPVKAATRRFRLTNQEEEFQSTPPVKAATTLTAWMMLTLRFQSTPPVKAATLSIFGRKDTQPFQSTPPVKAATWKAALKTAATRISIHAAREGGDDIQL